MTDRTRSATALFLGVAASAMGYTMIVAVLPLTATGKVAKEELKKMVSA